MQVSKLGDNKIQITLTHTEVICCFGAYEKLLRMSAKTKTAIKILISDIIEEYYGFSYNGEISADIKTHFHKGCIITLSPSKPIKNPKEYLLYFENSEKLIEGTLALHRILRKKAYASSLYTLNNKYYILLSYSIEKRYIMPLRKFYNYIIEDTIKTEYIKEHGKLITKKNAVSKIFSAFIRET